MSEFENGSLPAILGGSHGYAFDGDEVDLNAEIDIRAEDIELTLQLWACSKPHEAGLPTGTKVAEIPVTGVPGLCCVNTTVPASLPAGTDDHVMVVVLTNGAGVVLDWSNYPRRESFLLPRLGGEVSYRIVGKRLHLEAGTIANPRTEGTLSGSLNLELWALSEPYQGGAFEGVGLGSASVGQILGNSSLVGCLFETDLVEPPAGTWYLTMMLREWTGLAYRTRDYTNFRLPVSFPLSDGPDVEAHLPAHETRPQTQSTPPVQQCSGGMAVEDGPKKVSINAAPLEELQEVKGLPKAVAAAIVAGRPWANLEDTLSVKGMGPKLLEKLRLSIGL